MKFPKWSVGCPQSLTMNVTKLVTIHYYGQVLFEKFYKIFNKKYLGDKNAPNIFSLTSINIFRFFSSSVEVKNVV